MSYVDAIVDSIWFGRQIRSMRIRVKALYEEVQKAKRSEPSLEKEANRCTERLQKLLDYAERNSVMSSTDHSIASETLSNLEQIQQLLREKRPWWQKLLSWVGRAISFVIRLLARIIPIIPILPSGLREPLLALLVTLDVVVVGLLPPAE